VIHVKQQVCRQKDEREIVKPNGENTFVTWSCLFYTPGPKTAPALHAATQRDVYWSPLAPVLTQAIALASATFKLRWEVPRGRS
jgi:hypothetical protein